MQNKRRARDLIFILVTIIILTAFSGYSGDKESIRYNELIKSYSRGKDFTKGTDALYKSVKSAKDKKPAEALDSLINPKLDLPMTKSGNLRGIPILIYHCVNSTIWGDKPMFVSPDNFDRQMKYLKGHGYNAITFSDLSRLNSMKNPVMITFDDGYEDNYTNAFPILKKYEFKATVFLIANSIDRPKFLKLQQIKKMQDIIDFQSHTMSHPHLASLDPLKIEYELSRSKADLESRLGKKISVLSYPYGNYDSRVIDIARKYYKFGVTTNFGKFIDTPSNEYTVKRMYVINQMNLGKFIKLFK